MRLAFPQCAEADNQISQSKHSELFAVLLKSLGVWEFVAAASTLPASITFAHRYSDRMSFLYFLTETFAGPAVSLAIGYVLFFKTDFVIRLAFLTTSGEANQDGGSTTATGSAREVFVVIQKTLAAWIMVDGLVSLLQAISKATNSTVKGTDSFNALDTFALPVISVGRRILAVFCDKLFCAAGLFRTAV